MPYFLTSLYPQGGATEALLHPIGQTGTEDPFVLAVVLSDLRLLKGVQSQSLSGPGPPMFREAFAPVTMGAPFSASN